MSSDRQRLVGAIRRIAGIDPDDGERAAAAANRGSQPGSVGRGITESDDRLCCDGSISGNINPGTSTSDPSDGGGEGLDGSDPSDLGDIGSGELTGVTDCDTGDPVCFSAECIPPDGWSDCRDAPVDPYWEEGLFYFSQTTGGNIYGATPSEVASQVGEVVIACGSCDFGIGGPCGDNVVARRGNFVEGTGFGCSADIAVSECSGSHAAEWYCNTDPNDYRLDAWPSDGCVNLSIINGTIVGSKYDPENDGSYSAPRDEIELCDGSNGSILIRGSASGGWKSIASLSGDIDPDTDHGYLYSAYGDTIRQISPSEFRDDRV